MLLLTLLASVALIGCPAPVPKSDAAPKGPVVLLPVSPPLLGLHLADISATNGSGARDVVDGDPATGWRPSAPTGARLRLGFDQPVTADELRVIPCPAGAPVAVEATVNGSVIGSSPSSAEPAAFALGISGTGGRVIGVDIRVVEGKLGTCLGEVQLVEHGVALPLRPPRTATATVRASSVLPPAETHHPDLLFDHRLDFGWTEAKPGDGVGESVEVTMNEVFGLLALDVWNGDQGPGRSFGDRPRVRALGLAADSGGRITLAVVDEPGAQRIDLPRMLVGRTFTLSVMDVHPGAISHDLAISEIRLVDLLGRVSLEIEGGDARRADVLARVRRTRLEGDLDVPFESLCEAGRTLTLRSDLGFEAVSGSTGQLAEGDWTLGEPAGPWLALGLEGSLRTRQSGWHEPEDQPVEAFAAGSAVQIAHVEALGRASFGKEVATLAALRPCLKAVGVAGGMDPFDLLVKRDAVVVTGALGTDLLSRP